MNIVEKRSRLVLIVATILGIIYGIILYNIEMSQVPNFNYEVDYKALEAIAKEIINENSIRYSEIPEEFNYELVGNKAGATFSLRMQPLIENLTAGKSIYEQITIKFSAENKILSINRNYKSEEEILGNIKYKIIGKSIIYGIIAFLIINFIVSYICCFYIYK